MRAVLLWTFLLLLAAPASAADYWQSDNLLECLVGKGAVLMRHGETATQAVADATIACKPMQDPPPPANVDGADYSPYVYGLAFQILTRTADVI